LKVGEALAALAPREARLLLAEATGFSEAILWMMHFRCAHPLNV
jgi:hypothetical protein